jgi:hypothetical protein
MILRKAVRHQVKLKLNLSGPSGAGKTYSALLLAKGLVCDWGKIAVIDTENSSSALYSNLGEFNILDLRAPFSPEAYIKSIDICVDAGIECIIIDSCSHEWHGSGGCLEINEKIAQRIYKGNTWAAWNETTPRHEKFIHSIMNANVHVIACTRSKTESVQGENKKVHKIGLKDQQRDGWEYEYSVSLHIDRETHSASASKDRTGLFESIDPFVITEQTGVQLLNWCSSGIDSVAAVAEKLNYFKSQINCAPSKNELEVLALEIKDYPFSEYDLYTLKCVYSDKIKLLNQSISFINAVI